MSRTKAETYVLDWRVSARLKQLRLAAGMTGTDVAAKAGISSSKVARIELGRNAFPLSDLRVLLKLYGLEEHGDETQHIVDLAASSAEPHLGVKGSPRTSASGVLRETCTEIRLWAPEVLPPPLRTEAYERALATAVQDLTGQLPSEVARAAKTAAAWSDRVSARRGALPVRAVIDATTLRRTVGSAAIMRDQVSYLVMLTQEPGITLLVLPLGALAPRGTSAFTWMRFSDVQGTRTPDAVIFDDITAPEFRITNEEQVTYRCARTFGMLENAAENPAAALAAAGKAW
jgi:transcriptional regulator with XRE-family HTH domain